MDRPVPQRKPPRPDHHGQWRQGARDHIILADEPEEILGSNEAPNPQELLMAALNACMTVGYVAGAAKRGISLHRLEIETKGTLDLRGFFALSDAVPPGYPGD